MSKIKKIISVICILCIFSFLLTPMAAAEVIADTYIVSTNMQRYYYITNDNVVTEAYAMYGGEVIGDTISHIYQYPSARGYDALTLMFQFPEKKYVQGQTYTLKFDISTSQNYIYTYFLPNAIPLTFDDKFIDVGDVFLPNRVNNHFLASLTDTQEKDMQSSEYSSVTEVSFDISIPDDWMSGISEQAQRTVIIYLYSTFWATTQSKLTNITYSNIRLVPTGATQYLYQNKQFQDNVENELSDINQGIEDTNDKLDDTNDKLDDLINQPDQERQEANDVGDNNVNALIDALPHYENSLKQSFTALNTVFNYKGTNCEWEFPALYIPEISGVIPRIELSSSQNIDFVYWINKIPPTVLTLIQNVLTMALIVFCIKQFYDCLSEIFTNKELKE